MDEVYHKLSISAILIQFVFQGQNDVNKITISALTLVLKQEKEMNPLGE